MAIFELFGDDSGCYRFRLKTAAGEVIALSDAYLTRVSADGEIEAIRRHAATAFVDDQALLAPVAALLVDGG